MNGESNVLIITAASIGFVHTILGPDHYVPFIMMAWSRNWSRTRTALITFLCGLGHILSSVALGLIGVAAGLAVDKLTPVEAQRGNIAAWLLIAFGLAYATWGLRRAYRNKPHTHSHPHADLQEHKHLHTHEDEHSHPHNKNKGLTPWALFVIFVFGPCEPLIPVLMYPAAKGSYSGLAAVTFVFGAITISTMIGLVMLSREGIKFIPMKKLARYSHAIAGATILLCGLAIVFLGL